MQSHNKIHDFRLPLGALFTASVFTFLAYLAIPHEPLVFESVQTLPGHLRANVPAQYHGALEQVLEIDWLTPAYAVPYGTTKAIVKGLLITHVFEAAYTALLVKRHVSGFTAGMWYILTTLIFGMPIWKSLRQRVAHESRTRSSTKIH